MNQIKFFSEAIWRGLFISFGVIALFAIVYTRVDYSIVDKAILVMIFSMLFVGFFFSKSIKVIVFTFIATGVVSDLYIYFYPLSYEPFKFYKVLLPIIILGFLNLAYLKVKKD